MDELSGRLPGQGFANLLVPLERVEKGESPRFGATMAASADVPRPHGRLWAARMARLRRIAAIDDRPWRNLAADPAAKRLFMLNRRAVRRRRPKCVRART